MSLKLSMNKKIQKLFDIAQVVKCFGPGFVFQGSWHVAAKKAGFFKRKFPLAKWSQLSLSSFLNQSLTKDELKKTLKQTRFFNLQQLYEKKNILEEVNGNIAATIQRADDIIGLKFRYFSKTTVQLDESDIWHINPFTQGQVASDKHWSQLGLYDTKIGDIKCIWEISRFAWVFDLVRAYGLTTDRKYAEKFWELFENWFDTNQPNYGVNWASGQECALRIMACCFGLFAFLDEEITTEAKIEKMFLVFAVHAERIEGFISHAIRQRTNHAMTEASGLYTIGTLFPFFSKAEKWKKSVAVKLK